jgi:(p)ppGpp synthase/HD superfamily hydrolase
VKEKEYSDVSEMKQIITNLKKAGVSGEELADVFEAYHFMKDAHEGQFRKYSDVPYRVHPVSVALIVSKQHNLTRAKVVAALLHDTIEDTEVTFGMISSLFGSEVARLVLELTKISLPSDGNRAFRRMLDRRYLARVSLDAKGIKLADVTNNTSNIVQQDPKFAKQYLKESLLLIPLIQEGNYKLHALLDVHIRKSLEELA